MKLQEISFAQPVQVVQVFRNINVYDKTLKSFESRKERMEWKAIPSKSGYVKSGELYLPEQILVTPDFTGCGLITIEDENNTAAFSSLGVSYVLPAKSNPVYNHCFHFARKCELDIFRIKKSTELELHLEYDYFKIGIPERENFKICELTINKPVEIKINGKIDASLSSRRERAYKEQAYIFEYLGEFDNCKIQKEPYEAIIKQVPENRKVIDLLKPLW